MVVKRLAALLLLLSGCTTHTIIIPDVPKGKPELREFIAEGEEFVKGMESVLADVNNHEKIQVKMNITKLKAKLAIARERLKNFE